VKGVLFALLIFALQSALGVLLPANFAPPDLFLLAALASSARLQPVAGLWLGFTLGLLRDVLGVGVIGLHASAIAAGVYAAFGVRRVLSGESSLNHAVAVFVAELAKWLVFIVMGYWTRQPFLSRETWLFTLVPDAALTLLVAPLVYWLADWAFGPVPSSDERLL
jgi:rod shape-determining protein MreD